MRTLTVVLCLFVAAIAAFGQAATGTLTGTVTDQTGGSVAGAAVQVKNSETGVVFPTVTTTTGSYTLPGLPPGTYELDVTFAGFKKYVHTNLALAAAQTLRQDLSLELG